MASRRMLVDGGALEGGGQILRNASALSCLLEMPITVNNIRAGRSNPGLRPQHLTGLQLIRDICGGRLEGGKVSSTEINFDPSHVRRGRYMADTHTAGSICLLIQGALPCLAFADGPTEMVLRGGTNAEMAPQIDYLTWILQPMAAKFGLEFECDIIRRGYYPKGGGEVVLRCSPVRHLTAVELMDVGEIERISGRSFVAGVLPVKVAHIMAEHAREAVRKTYPGIPMRVDVVKEPHQAAVGTGTGIIMAAHTTTNCWIGAATLGKKGVSAEQVGRQAGELLINNLYHGGCVDDFLQDQLIIFMAIAKGKSRVKCGQLSLHTETAIHVTQLLTQAKFTVSKEPNSMNTIIECEGIGLENKHL